MPGLRDGKCRLGEDLRLLRQAAAFTARPKEFQSAQPCTVRRQGCIQRVVLFAVRGAIARISTQEDSPFERYHAAYSPCRRHSRTPSAWHIIRRRRGGCAGTRSAGTHWRAHRAALERDGYLAAFTARGAGARARVVADACPGWRAKTSCDAFLGDGRDIRGRCHRWSRRRAMAR